MTATTTTPTAGALSRNPVFALLDRQGPLLTAEQERVLARKARHGCSRSRAELVERNLRLVIDLARRTRPRTEHDLMDRIQAGALGLMRAVDKFDPDKGFRLSTYATWWIKQAISRDRNRNGHPPDDVTLVSLDAPVTGESTTSLGELLEDGHADDPATEAERHDLKAVIERHLATLPPPARRAIRLRYGLDTGAPETIQTIATQLAVDAPTARRLTFDAIQQLQQHVIECEEVPA